MRKVQWARVPVVTLGAIGVAALVTARGDAASPAPGGRGVVHALAPVAVVASGFEQLSAVAVEPGGAILVSDRARGTLTQIDTSGQRRVLVDHLHGPSGLAVNRDGDILIVEAAGGRVLRFGADGTTTVVASGLRQPQSIAVGWDGRVWLAVRQSMGAGRDDDDHGGGLDDGEGRPGAEYVVASLDSSGALTTVATGFMGVQALAADGEAVYIAMARLATERGRARTTVARVRIGADGTAGPTEPVLSGVFTRTRGLGIDAMGALFVGGTADRDDDGGRGAVVKRHSTGRLTGFAAGLTDPVALAFAPNGDLVVAERGRHGRVLRFRAPSAPVPAASPFTNQNPLPIGGQAGPGDSVDVFVPADRVHPVATATADASSGAFALDVPLASNAASTLSFVATAAAGSGLVGPVVTASIVHDDHLPGVAIVEPSPGSFVRDAVTLRARGEDEGSGVASVTFMLDDVVVATVQNENPSVPITANAIVDVRASVEGPHTVTVAAADRAGNSAAVAQLLVVDRTPPETSITRGPGVDTTERTVTFTIEGTDVQSPAPEFSWRIDAGVWSPYTPSGTIVVRDLLPGPHRFEARARDLAGNEDSTPAAQSFTVTVLRIRITEPADGAVVTAPSVWLRGTVESGGDVTVSVPLPPGMGVPALPAVTEAGTFAVQVPIDGTATTLTATATDVATGATATHTIRIVVEPDSGLSTSGFAAFPSAGLAPHVVVFHVNLGDGTRVALDVDGDGTVDFDGTALENLPFLYDRPGIYVPALRATTADGLSQTYRTSVEVYDRAALDARLQAVWNGLRQALEDGNIDRAVSFVHGNRRAAWQEYFRQLPADEVAVEASAFTAIELIQVGRGGAEYEMLREENGQTVSYPVVFVADVDGRWRLWQF